MALCVEIGVPHPHLIVRAAATPASSDDATQTTMIHHDLANHGIHPAEHFADTGYSSAKLIVQARTAGIDLVAPVKLPNGLSYSKTPCVR